MALQLPGAGLGLGEVFRHIVFVEEDLALQVVRLDEVAIDQPKMSDAGTDQDVGQNSAEGTAAAQRHMAGKQTALALHADAVEAHLPAVSFQRHVHLYAAPLNDGE